MIFMDYAMPLHARHMHDSCLHNQTSFYVSLYWWFSTCNYTKFFFSARLHTKPFYLIVSNLGLTYWCWGIEIFLHLFSILQLHLNPVHAVVQLRPSLEHLKPGGSKRKDRVTGDAEVTVKRENSSEEKSLAPSKKQVLSLPPGTDSILLVQVLVLYSLLLFMSIQ